MSVLQHNANGSHYCTDCRSIVVLFDDDIHECTADGERMKRGDLEMRQAWVFEDHKDGRTFTVEGDYEAAFIVFADECEAKYPTPDEEDDDER